MRNEQGFSLIEVAIASIIIMVGLVSLASLFTLAIGQNRIVKQHTTTTALAQQKIEELMAIERNDARLVFPVGQTSVGGLTEATKVDNYFDSVCVDSAGTPSTDCPGGQVPAYTRFWKLENDPGGIDRAIVIAVRVVAVQAGRGGRVIGTSAPNEETTLTTVRSF
jgi:type II secretory pathway pseudopilin PulG